MDKLHRLWATKNKDDEWWSSFVTSPLAIAVNYVVVDIKWLTPNLITLFSFLVAIVSAVFIIQGSDKAFIIAAILIHASHILDCMDGQMARYRNVSTLSGGYFDKLTDQIQVPIWFGAVGYAAYEQSQDVLPVILALIGISFYMLRGYSKYIGLYSQVSHDRDYIEKAAREDRRLQKSESAGIDFTFAENFRWLVAEQRKFLYFDEGVFIFMLSLALIFDKLTPMLWVFAVTQIIYGLGRGWQRGSQIGRGEKMTRNK